MRFSNYFFFFCGGVSQNHFLPIFSPFLAIFDQNYVWTEGVLGVVRWERTSWGGGRGWGLEGWGG